MRRLVTMLCVSAAGFAALVPAASADEQQPLPPDQRYDGTCGHLGSDCGGDEPRARAPRSRSGATMRSSGRVRVRRQPTRRASSAKPRSAERPRSAGASR